MTATEMAIAHAFESAHIKTVVADGPDWRMSCSCGYLSLSCENPAQAAGEDCAVEAAQNHGRIRRAAWAARQGEAA